LTRAGEQLGIATDRALLRFGLAVSRGLLMDLVAGEDPAEVDAAHDLLRLAGAPPGSRDLAESPDIGNRQSL
jgi:hypothetical protein